jgi:hypothetical protein
MGSNIFFLNVQERGSQSWEEIRRFGFISTAGCPRALDAMDHADYKLPVRWLRAFDRNEAKWSPRSGLYASPQIKAPISNQPITLRYLQDAFGMRI